MFDQRHSGKSWLALILGMLASAGKAPIDMSPRPVRAYFRSRNRFLPHQGKRECARRRRQIAAGTLRVPSIKPRARLEDWEITRLGGRTRLAGVAHGHPHIPDGTRISTSAVLSIDGTHAETRNTYYALGQPAA